MTDEVELGYREFDAVGPYTGMPDQKGVKFVVFDPMPDDPSSGPVFQFGSCPRQDFPFQTQIHPGKTILEWDWMDPDHTKYEVRGAVVVAKEGA